MLLVPCQPTPMQPSVTRLLGDGRPSLPNAELRTKYGAATIAAAPRKNRLRVHLDLSLIFALPLADRSLLVTNGVPPTG